MYRPQILSPDIAKQLIKLILDQGTVKLSRHCRRDSMPARSVTILDIHNCLAVGQILRSPEWDEQHQQWKYRVEGIDMEGDVLTSILVIFDAELILLVVTVF